MIWKPSRDPERYDRQKMAHLQPLKDAVRQMGLPLPRLRKITGIISFLPSPADGAPVRHVPSTGGVLLDALVP